MVGTVVTLQKASISEVTLLLDGSGVGYLHAAIGSQVASAIDRGLVFTAVIEKAFPNYVDTGRASGNGKFTQVGATLDIKVEYFLEKGQPAIETERCWRCVESTEKPQPETARSFFTKVAGVTFEGRQRVVARCSVGEPLVLVRDPENRFDKGAIKVMRSNGEQLGFIPAHVTRNGHSSGLAFRMDRGDTYQCRISNLTGNGMTLGVNIEIREGEFEAAEAPADLSLAPLVPVQNMVGWWLFLAFAVLLVVVAIVTYTH
jgi:single-stranded-DNA-specific exonuclease